MRRTCSTCCVRAVSGHAVAATPPIVGMKSRRLKSPSLSLKDHVLWLSIQASKQESTVGESGQAAMCAAAIPSRLCPSWVKSQIPRKRSHVSFRQRLRTLGCVGSRQLCATSGLMHCSKELPYSITLSAAISTDEGTITPRVLAVFKLMTNSNLVGCCTGKSEGAAPLRIFVHVIRRSPVIVAQS